jgi:hypothetical protein
VHALRSKSEEPFQKKEKGSTVYQRLCVLLLFLHALSGAANRQQTTKSQAGIPRRNFSGYWAVGLQCTRSKF